MDKAKCPHILIVEFIGKKFLDRIYKMNRLKPTPVNPVNPVYPQ
jgi:hypothetical protein